MSDQKAHDFVLTFVLNFVIRVSRLILTSVFEIQSYGVEIWIRFTKLIIWEITSLKEADIEFHEYVAICSPFLPRYGKRSSRCALFPVPFDFSIQNAFMWENFSCIELITKQIILYSIALEETNEKLQENHQSLFHRFSFIADIVSIDNIFKCRYSVL